MNKPKNEKPKAEDKPQTPKEEQNAYLPESPLENVDSEDETQGLPKLNPKDWKKFIGCGG